MGIGPSVSIFVGDDPISDIEASTLIGLRTIYVPVKENFIVRETVDVTFAHGLHVASRRTYIDSVD
jgi:FMN phosphatase YigB (HAD superfamily)